MGIASKEWTLSFLNKAFKRFGVTTPYLTPISIQSTRNTTAIQYTYTADDNKYVLVTTLACCSNSAGTITTNYTCDCDESKEIFTDQWSQDAVSSYGGFSNIKIYKLNKDDVINITTNMPSGNNYCGLILGVFTIDGISSMSNITKIWEAETGNQTSLSTSYAPDKNQYIIRVGMYQYGAGSPGTLSYNTPLNVKIYTNATNQPSTIVLGGNVYTCFSLYETLTNQAISMSQNGTTSSKTRHMCFALTFEDE